MPLALSDLDWLGQVSAYGERGTYPGRGASGPIGLGNGRAFGMVGLERPWNTLTNAVGPRYDRDEGYFGDASISLWRGGEALPVDEEAAQRVRGAAVARTLARSGGLSLLTTDAAPPGFSGILRVLTVRNDGSSPAAGLSLRITLARGPGERVPAWDAGLRQDRGGQQLLISCGGEGAVSDDGALSLTLPTLPPGEEQSIACTWAVGEEGDLPALEGDALQALQATRERGQALLSRAVALSLPDPKVEDLLEGILLTEQVQTAESGLVSPMSRYTSAWLRDAEGPVRVYLRAGLWEEARALLDAQYRTLVVQGGILNSFPAQEDLSAFAEPDDPDSFWAEAAFMPGREPVEAPSYPVLLTALYAGQTGDDSLHSGVRIAFLEAALRRQVDEGGLMRFSGDETFRFNLAAATGAGMPEEVGWSAQSSFLFAAAAEALGVLGGDPALVARGLAVRDAAEEAYWEEAGGFYTPIRYFEGGVHPRPFEDVQPLWVGYGAHDLERARRHVEASVEALQREDGSFLSPGSSGAGEVPGYTGMVPGISLAALVAVGHPAAEAAFHAVDLTATPSGSFAEGHAADHQAMALLHTPDGLGGDVTARLRPWEAGDVGAGVYRYLLGQALDAEAQTLSLAPQLPAGWPWLEARGLRLPDGACDLSVERYQEGMRAVVDGAEGWVVTLTLTGERPFARAWLDGEAIAVAGGVELIATLPGGGELIAAY